MSRPNWERRHLGGETGPPVISPFIGVAGVSPATGTTGVPPVVKGTKQATQNPRAITVRNNHTLGMVTRYFTYAPHVTMTQLAI